MKREDKFQQKRDSKVHTQISLDSTLDVNGIPGGWWSRKRQWSPEAWSSSEGRKGRQLRSAAALTILPASPQTTSQFSWISATFAQEPCAIYLLWERAGLCTFLINNKVGARWMMTISNALLKIWIFWWQEGGIEQNEWHEILGPWVVTGCTKLESKATW